ncbi:MAG TPA: SRPBCC family protein [Burkholderiales bacterium]|jgi:carbon monoxide dehydrogenase subunit G|nr:SRPBCC family protein [Burkholderiales bacterium]
MSMIAGRILQRNVALAAVALAAAWSAPCFAQSQEISIRTVRDGEFVVVSASVVMRVDLHVAWAVLSDYDQLARFIPDMKSSRVISRDGNKLRVEQKGEMGFFFYKEPVSMLLDVHEEPPTRITARGIEGNIKGLETRYELHSSAAGVRLDYAGRFIPDFSIPPLIGMPIMNRLIERRFRAMVNEIQRRDALARAASKQK